MTISPRVLETSTITPREREIFQNLFQEAIQKAERQVSASKNDKTDEQEGDERKKPRITEDALSNVDKFPLALREIARSAAQSVEFYKYQASLAEPENSEDTVIEPEHVARQNELREQQHEELQRIKSLMHKAKTDVGLWAVLEKELFGKIEALCLDTPILPEVLPKEINEEKSEVIAKNIAFASAIAESSGPVGKAHNFTETKKRFDQFAVLRPIYPVLLVTAAQILRTHFPRSGHVFAILPRVREIGDASFALGVTTALYNELISATWSNMDSFYQVCDILEEMDKSGFEFDNDTFIRIRKMRRDWNTQTHGTMTALERAAAQMDLMQGAYIKLTTWRKVIQERLEAEALRKANQQINEKMNAII
jgi:hypothetical protein